MERFKRISSTYHLKKSMSLLDVFKKKAPTPPPFPESTEEMPTGPPTDVPLESVLIMQQQGLTNPQIIQSLQRQGYSLPLVAEALRQTDVQTNIGTAEPIAPQPVQTQEQPSASGNKASFFEDVLAQLQKNFSEINEEIKSLQSWRTNIEEKTTEIDKRVENLQNEVKTIHQAVFAQIQEYNKTLKGVGTEIIAMEKVFSESLPELTGNIQELQRITKGFKNEITEEGKKTKRSSKFEQ